METVTGYVTGINGNLANVSFEGAVHKNEVGYILDRTSGVRKVSFNNKKVPKDYFITMNTVEKDEDGTLVPYIITAYKAAIERNLELSFSSEGDPASLTITFNLLADKDGNVMDIMEDTENAE